MLELVELAKIYPHETLPIIEHALESNNPNVQWLAVLELIELAKSYPDEVSPIIGNLVTDDDASTIEDTRLLVEMGKNSYQEIMPYIQQGLTSNNNNLRWATLNELFMLAQNDVSLISGELKRLLNNDEIASYFTNSRILIELGKNEPQQIFSLLKIALSSNNNVALQRAVFREIIELVKLGAIDLSQIESMIKSI